jgi:hypothetical protein
VKLETKKSSPLKISSNQKRKFVIFEKILKKFSLWKNKIKKISSESKRKEKT